MTPEEYKKFKEGRKKEIQTAWDKALNEPPGDKQVKRPTIKK